MPQWIDARHNASKLSLPSSISTFRNLGRNQYFISFTKMQILHYDVIVFTFHRAMMPAYPSRITRTDRSFARQEQ